MSEKQNAPRRIKTETDDRKVVGTVVGQKNKMRRGALRLIAFDDAPAAIVRQKNKMRRGALRPRESDANWAALLKVRKTKCAEARVGHNIIG